MIFDKATIKSLFELGETQLERYRAAGLPSKCVRVRGANGATRRRLYSLYDLAQHLAASGRKLPKGITEAARPYAWGVVSNPCNDDDDEPPPIPDTEAGRAFVLGFLCGCENAEDCRTFFPDYPPRMEENRHAAWVASCRHMMERGELPPDFLDGIDELAQPSIDRSNVPGIPDTP